MNIKHNITSYIGVFLILCLVSCTNELFEEDCQHSDTANSEVHVQPMKVFFNKPVFEGSNNTRTIISEEWKDGDVLYLRFQTESSFIQGKAVYSTSNNNWTVTYKGELPTDKESSMQVWYFDGETSEEGNNVNLSAETCPYHDNNGFYLYNSEKELTCVACLKPATCRLRFIGNSGLNVTVDGLTTYIYDKDAGTISHSSPTSIYLSVLSSGSTPYIYVIKDGISPDLCVSDGSNDYYMNMDDNFLKGYGHSGYINLPNSTQYEGWKCYKHHDYVDLGLPSGTLWATCNVGAETPEGFGEYYAWGEISTKAVYYNNYQYTETPDVLPLQDDVANVKWGGKWRMPTLAEVKELVSLCTSSYTFINGIKGLTVTSKVNGKSIFFPRTGSYNDGLFYYSDEQGMYWSSTSEDNSLAYALYFSDFDGFTSHWFNKYFGFPVRPVRTK